MAKTKTKATTMIALEALEIQLLPIRLLKPNDYNPNRQPETEFLMLIKSIRDDGFTRPIIAHEDADEDGRLTIVDGEHRWTGMIVFNELLRRNLVWDAKGKPLNLDKRVVNELRQNRLLLLDDVGDKTIPVVVVGMSIEQMRLATLRHNRARGSEDLDLAAEVVRDLEKLGVISWAKDALGLKARDIEIALGELTAVDWADSQVDFSAAWEPLKEGHLVSPELHASQAANLKERQAATTLGEYFRISNDVTAPSDVFRVNGGVLSAQDAILVRGILWPEPALRLPELCRIYQQEGDGSVEAVTTAKE